MMSKAEEYLKKSIRKCQEGDRPYNEWVSTDCAKLAIEIAREEMIEKAAKWLSKLSNYNAEFIYPAYSGTIENFANSFKQAMKDG